MLSSSTHSSATRVATTSSAKAVSKPTDESQSDEDVEEDGGAEADNEVDCEEAIPKEDYVIVAQKIIGQLRTMAASKDGFYPTSDLSDIVKNNRLQGKTHSTEYQVSVNVYVCTGILYAFEQEDNELCFQATYRGFYCGMEMKPEERAAAIKNGPDTGEKMSAADLWKVHKTAGLHVSPFYNACRCMGR
jgi:hypothetical protein